ncbi:mediator of RNA polymerase II transcription subunit 8-like [Hydractinia symbiolongicarpus]|uniref:mediator of RNA polymerase II transcription subunit 8-like n=1 Tax=Hydractinia symbiolongicarpus TaxID=13093 RepID=UPI00254E76DE|nr:mediator of RNA polymerase II transcription subunit 8-like [Hydractinia symbiolongicarpus]
MQDEKAIETSLQNLISRVGDIKISLQSFLLKLEHESLTWPQVLDNFALLSGQINTLNKVLKNDRMPVLRNLCILPILVSQEHDEELAGFTENRIPIFNHEVVPDAMRTKYEPEVEKEEQHLIMQASSIQIDDAQRQVSMLNDMVATLLDLIQAERDDWDAESAVQQANLAPSEKDTNILIAAITQGAGLRKRPESSGRSSSNRSQSKHGQTHQGNRSSTPRT